MTRGPSVLPPQHGAWGFLGLPLLLGVAAAGWTPWLAPLAVAWVAAYPSRWALTGVLTDKRPERFRGAALVWTPLCAVAGLPVLVFHPWLVWALVGYALLFAVNLQQTRARRERSLANDLVLIAECVLLIPVYAGIAAGETGLVAAMTAPPVLVASLLAALTLVGSTLHVKSLIRERRNPAYTVAARVFALAAPWVVAAACVAAGLPWWLAAPFALLAARALWPHDPAWRPARIGMVELGGLLAVAATGLVGL